MDNRKQDANVKPAARRIVAFDFDSIENLPTLPTVVQRALSLTADPRSSAKDLAEVIALDQALTARVLRIVNSAFYGLSRKISTVKDGIVVLGFNAVRSIATAASVVQMFGGRGGHPDLFNYGEFWIHSIGVGICSMNLAQAIRYPRADHIFTAGILHDVGKIILDQHARDHFLTVLERAKRESSTFRDAEEAVGGPNHAFVGDKLAVRWNLPEELGAGMGGHHDPQSTDSPFARVVYLADKLCKAHNVGHAGDFCPTQVTSEDWEMIGLSEAAIASVLSQMDLIKTRAKLFIEAAK